LFSATAEHRSAPFGDKCFVLAPELPCRPCLKKKCRLPVDKNKCCDMVQAEELVNLLKDILQLH
jgi:hypothetical protein